MLNFGGVFNTSIIFNQCLRLALVMLVVQSARFVGASAFEAKRALNENL